MGAGWTMPGVVVHLLGRHHHAHACRLLQRCTLGRRGPDSLEVLERAIQLCIALQGGGGQQGGCAGVGAGPRMPVHWRLAPQQAWSPTQTGVPYLDLLARYVL